MIFEDFFFADIWRSYSTPTSSGVHYFLTIVDNFLRCTWVFLTRFISKTYTIQLFLLRFKSKTYTILRYFLKYLAATCKSFVLVLDFFQRILNLFLRNFVLFINTFVLLHLNRTMLSSKNMSFQFNQNVPQLIHLKLIPTLLYYHPQMTIMSLATPMCNKILPSSHEPTLSPSLPDSTTSPTKPLEHQPRLPLVKDIHHHI